jgi:hypothetical protein
LDERQVSAPRFGVPGVTKRAPTPLHIVLERVQPAKNLARYYVLSIEPTLFAKDTLVRRWGRIGFAGAVNLTSLEWVAG